CRPRGLRPRAGEPVLARGRLRRPRAEGAPRALPREGLAGAALVGLARPRLQPLARRRRVGCRLLARRRETSAARVLRLHDAEAGRDRVGARRAGRRGLERRARRVPAPVRRRPDGSRPARHAARVPRDDVRSGLRPRPLRLGLRHPPAPRRHRERARRGCARRHSRLARPSGRRPGCARLPARPLPRARLRPLDELLVRRPVQLRRLQPQLLPARRAARHQAASRHQRRRRDRVVHAHLRAHMGLGGGLGGAGVRARGGGVGPDGGVPVRARARVRADGPRRPRQRPSVALRPPRRAHLRREPARVRAPARRPRRDRVLPLATRARQAGAADSRRRRARRRPVAALPRRRTLPVLDGRARGRAHLLRARVGAHLARRAGAHPALVLRPLRPARRRFAAVPLAVLTLSLRRWRPLPYAFGAFALALSWNATPLAYSFVRTSSDPSEHAAFWRPAIRYLHRELTPAYRVEAVDTAGHWEAVYLARAGIPIVRGWFRQDDFPQNELLYDPFGRRPYLRWLHELGARYVVLPNAPLDYSARNEAKLLRSGRSGLTPVFRTRDLTIYAVPAPVPIVTGPGQPRVLALTDSTILLRLARAGTYRLALHYSPYLAAPGACMRATADGMIELRNRRPGVLKLAFTVTASRALAAIAGSHSSCGEK